jgi:hypothetical protein
MQRKKILMALAAVLFVAVVNPACEDSGSGPGSDGMVNTGSRLMINYIIPSDADEDTNAIDMVQSLCGGTTEAEIFTDAKFSIEFEVTGTTPSNTATTGIILNSYRVDYYSSSPGAVPIPSREFGINVYIPPNGIYSIDGLFTLLVVGDKMQWVSDGGDPWLFPDYDCVITFKGTNEFGYEVEATGYVNIECGIWNNC